MLKSSGKLLRWPVKFWQRETNPKARAIDAKIYVNDRYLKRLEEEGFVKKALGPINLNEQFYQPALPLIALAKVVVDANDEGRVRKLSTSSLRA